MTRITTTIKREWLAQIIAGTKKIEYREAKPYWDSKIQNIKLPFELRMINGMSKRAPEVTVLIDWWERKDGLYALHIAKVLAVKNWLTVAMIRRAEKQLIENLKPFDYSKR